MSRQVVSAAAALRKALVDFDPGLLSGRDCARVADALAATEKSCGAARILAAARAVECDAHKERGFRDGTSWLATQTGETRSKARQTLETAKGLTECPETKAALLCGEVSVEQAAEITRTERDTPGAESQLLEVARDGDLSTLRERAREHREHHSDPNDLHRRQRRARNLRLWKDRLGMTCFSGALPPETGIPFANRLEAETQRFRRKAKKDGAEPESFEATTADAFASLVMSGGRSRPPTTELVIVCDLYAFRRGHSHQGEVCHLIDGGPIPVDLAKELSKDAFLKAVLHDGVNIHTVKHFRRYRNVELQTALDLGPVPAFTGARCADCGGRHGLQYDHVDPVANNGPTEYKNLKARCYSDHRDKTERDRQAGLLGPRAKNRSP